MAQQSGPQALSEDDRVVYEGPAGFISLEAKEEERKVLLAPESQLG